MAEPLTLRPLSVVDAPAMTEVLEDPALYEYTGGEPPSVEELHRQYEVQTRGRSIDGREQWINSIVELGEEHRPIGYIQATVPLDGSDAEVAWVIGRRWQGHGYAKRAVLMMLRTLHHEGVHRVMAHIHPGHAASQAVARAAGMEPTGLEVDGEERWCVDLDHLDRPR